jgi:hypothetical protein
MTVTIGRQTAGMQVPLGAAVTFYNINLVAKNKKGTLTAF